MSDYTQTVFFAPKDALLTGDPDKLVRGSEFDTELAAIAVAIATKLDVTDSANPTGTVGLTVVNGSAATYMRSDGAPALSQAIVPTWTQNHTFSARVLLADGSASDPALTFSADLNTGLIRSGADQVDFVANAVATLRINASGVGVKAGNLFLTDGTVSLPGLTFDGDTNTGLFRGFADTLQVATGGGESVRFNAQGVGLQDGVAATPGLFFTNDTNTGIYRVGADSIGAVAGGVTVWHGTGTSFNPDLQVQAEDGGASAPGYSFENDTNTGIYRASSDTMVLAAAGAGQFFINGSGAFYITASGNREVGFRGGEANPQSGTTYTLVQGDNGRIVDMGNGGATTVTVPTLASNTLITVINGSITNNLTLSQGGGVSLLLAGTTTTGNRTVATRGIATLFTPNGTAYYVTGAGVS